MPQPAIHVAGIRKTYGRTVAVDDVSFDVQPGEIFGLIGPNGAGKTTTMECVEGLRTTDSGTIAVLGLDPGRDAVALQHRIGVQLVLPRLSPLCCLMLCAFCYFGDVLNSIGVLSHSAYPL